MKTALNKAELSLNVEDVEDVEDVETYDNFALSQFLLCRRKYYWRIVRSLVPSKPSSSPARGFGAAFHAGLEAYYKSADMLTVAEKFSQAWNESGLVGDDKRNEATGHKLLGLYALKYTPEWFVTVHEPEVGFAVELEDFLYAGRIDLIARDRFSGQTIIVDHKTSSRKPSSTEVKHRQITGYIWAAGELTGEDIRRGLINYVVLTTEPQFIRVLSTRTPEQIEEWKDATAKVVREIRQCKNYADYYCNQEMCNHYGECDYLDLCNTPSILKERVIAQKYEESPWEPYREEKIDGKA